MADITRLGRLARTVESIAMINDELLADLYAFLVEVGIERPRLQRIKAGRNSRVWRVDNVDGPFIVKEYHRHPGDSRDRLGTEYGFLVFLHECGITNVPQPLVCHVEMQRALYGYLPGEPVGVICDEHIAQAAKFIKVINRWADIEIAQQLPPASDACFSLRDHWEKVSMRLHRLEVGLTEGQQAVYEEALRFVAESLRPTFRRLEQRLMEQVSDSVMDHVLDAAQRVLSPSDFGFHNVLESGGQLAFVDFEYAGWDDPVKLCCDFACQPERPVTLAQASVFCERLMNEGFGRIHWRERVEMLLPLHRLKWCCILLNEFRIQECQRRQYAGCGQPELLQTQLRKARDYFTQHLGAV